MTHFAGLVIVPTKKLEATGRSEAAQTYANYGGGAWIAVSALTAPYVEDEEWGEDGTRFDWFMLGGRATGLLDGYNPDEDEQNFEFCQYCEGTGTTTQAVADKYPAYQQHVGKPCIQCNVGHGGEQKLFPGRKLKWSTEYAPHPGDIKPVGEIDMDRVQYPPMAVITPDGEWHEWHRAGMFASHLPREDGSEDPREDEWKRMFSALLDKYRDGHTAIVVDFHV